VASPDGRIDSAERAGQLGVRCPASGRIVGHVACMSATDVAVVAADLRRAQPGWQAMGAAGRGRVLLRWLDWILDNERRLLELLQAETGKSSGDAAIETTVAVDLINYYAKNSGRFLEDGHIAAHNLLGHAKRLRVRYEPYELVGQIFPWNYPVAMPMLDVPAALMAGAAVITKPSEATPLTWSEMVRGFREEIDAPAVLGAVTGDGAAGAAVVDEVDTIMFTGSTRTGRSVAVQAAQRLIPCSLELGGKDPMIVLGDANLDRAVAGAVWGGFSNAGQTCISVERVYVEDGIYDAFVTKLVGEVEKLRVGMDAPRSFSTDFGAIATEQQLQIIERHFHDALSKGHARSPEVGGLRAGCSLHRRCWSTSTTRCCVCARRRSVPSFRSCGSPRNTKPSASPMTLRTDCRRASGHPILPVDNVLHDNYRPARSISTTRWQTPSRLACRSAAGKTRGSVRGLGARRPCASIASAKR
jgi:acyl-CoA reductase-like NAD-dependent aldehyde dehydrogenase